MIQGIDANLPGFTRGEKATPEKVKSAACQFETLLVGQLLRTAREAGGSGWMGSESGGAGGQAIEFAEQFLAGAIAERGGFGFSDLVGKGLSTASAAKPQGE